MRIGRRYNVESQAPVEVAPGARVVWLRSKSGTTYELIEPGALVVSVEYDEHEHVYRFRLEWPGRQPYQKVIIVEAEQPVDVRFDDGVWPVRVHRWAWHYLTRFFTTIVDGVKWTARKVGELFGRLTGEGRWHW